MAEAVQTSRLGVISRVAASFLGSYALAWGFVALLITLQLRAGVAFNDARTLAYLLAFVVLLTAFLWSYAARSLVSIWSVLAGGGLVMTGAAWLISVNPV